MNEMLNKKEGQTSAVDWKQLFRFLRNGRIIPVIGSELIKVTDLDDRAIPLDQYIARKLANDLDTPYSGQTIGELARDNPGKNILLDANNIYEDIKPKKFQTWALERLAKIPHFKYFISTTMDDLLLMAICKERSLESSKVRIIDYSLVEQSTASQVENDQKNNEPEVTVFKVFGSIKNPTMAAFDDERKLEHCFSLTTRYGSPSLAESFMDQVRDKIFLFLGCNYPDWFMRYMIRIMTNRELSNMNTCDYFVHGDGGIDPALDIFLRRFHKNVVNTDIETFVNEMYQYWVENEKHPVRYQGSVFISYYKVDLERAKKLKKHFDANGIESVWLDKDDLKIGLHEQRIKKEIINAKVVIPLISGKLLAATNSYAKKKEWNNIKRRYNTDINGFNTYGDKNENNKKLTFSIIPIILDNTSEQDPRIPDFMKKFTIRKWTQGDSPEAHKELDIIIKDTREYLKEIAQEEE